MRRLLLSKKRVRMSSNRHDSRVQTVLTANARRILLVTLVLSIAGLAGFCKESKQHSVTLTWHASPSTPKATVVGYNVYRRTNPKTPYERIATDVSGTTYEDRLVKSRTTYYYAVTAVDQRGRESGFTIAVKVKVP